MNEAKAVEDLSLKETLRILFAASAAFWLVNQVNFFDGVAYFGILNLLTLYINNYVGLSTEATGAAVSLFTGGVTLFMFGGGFVSDKLGVRNALTLCLVGLLLGRVLLAMSGTGGAAVLWCALGIMALATGVLQPALYAGVKEFTDPRTATIGYAFLYSIMNLGIMFESIASPFIRNAPEENPTAGIPNVLWAMVGITVLMLVIHLIFFSKKVEDRDRTVDDGRDDSAEEEKTTLQKIKELPFLDVRFIFFIFILLPVRTLFAHNWMTLPDYVLRSFPADVGTRYEWFQALNPAIIVIFVPLIAAFTRKVNIVTMMIIGTSISAATTFILVPGPDVTRLIIYVVLFSIGEAVWSSRFLEYVADLAPAGKVGAYMGLAGIPWFLAKATTGLYSGKMLATYIPKEGPQDSGTLWLIYACIACISPIGLIIGKRWIDNRAAPVAT